MNEDQLAQALTLSYRQGLLDAAKDASLIAEAYSKETNDETKFMNERIRLAGRATGAMEAAAAIMKRVDQPKGAA